VADDAEPSAQPQRLAPDGALRDLAPRGAGPSTLPPRATLPMASALLPSSVPAPLPGTSPPAFRPEVAARHYPELAQYLDELEAALRQGRAPATADAWHLPELIEGLNLADPTLKLERHLFVLGAEAPEVLASSLAQRLRSSLGGGQAWRGVITDGDHGAAISLRFPAQSNDVSMLLVDSSAWTPRDVDRKRQAWRHTLGILTRDLQASADPQRGPVRLHLGITASDVQKTSEGCHIFALSAAKKLASDPTIATLHERALLGLSSGRISPGVNNLNANRLLPPSLFKHATSRGVLERYIAAIDTGRTAAQARREAGFTGWQRDWPDGQAPVNKKGQNLLERHAAHTISRQDPVDPHRQRSYSNSYEIKRIEMVRQALVHLTAGLT
jgi:hypothetical protein